VGGDPAHLLWFAASHLSDWQWPSIAVALVAALLLAVLKRWPKIPASMLVMLLALGFAQAVSLPSWGVQEIGSFERPALRLAWPDLPLADWLHVAELSFGLVMLVFAESWGSMRSTALQHGDRLSANRELAVLGACNMGAALLQGMSVGAGFSATTANAEAGAQSRAAGLVALAVVGAALLWALPAMHCGMPCRPGPSWRCGA
jgi:SulP family sulfate permease